MRHNINRENTKHEIFMGYIEYLATLISPFPKETVKAIEVRRKRVNQEKIARGEMDPDESEFKLFKKDHRNTTFFDAIGSEGGDEAISELAALFGDNPEALSSIEEYELDSEDVDFFDKALEMQNKMTGEPKKKDSPAEMDFDTIEF